MKAAPTYLFASTLAVWSLTVLASQDKAPAGPLAVAWQQEIEISGRFSISLGPEAVVIGSESGLVALSARDGRSLWRDARPSLARPVRVGQVLITASESAMEGLNEATGEMVWRAPIETAAVPELHAVGDLALAVRGPDVRAWRGDGTPAWRATLTASLATRFVSATDGLIAGLWNWDVVSLDPASGAVRWTERTRARLTGLTASGSDVFAADTEGDLFRFRVDRGLKRETTWRDRGIAAVGDPIVNELSVFYAFSDNSLKAFNRKSGSQRWSVRLPSRPASGPTFAVDHIAVALATGEIVQVPALVGRKAGDSPPPPKPTTDHVTAVDAASGTIAALVTTGTATVRIVVWRAGPKTALPASRAQSWPLRLR